MNILYNAVIWIRRFFICTLKLFLDILCFSFDTQGFRHAMTMVFAVEEINRNSKLLPNVTLGYSLYDNCGALVIGFRAALALASGQEEQFLQENCSGTPPVLGIVGDSYSTFSIATSNVLGLFRLPMVNFTFFWAFYMLFTS